MRDFRIRTQGSRRLCLAVSLAVCWITHAASAASDAQARRADGGGSEALLVRYYVNLTVDGQVEAFRERVTARFSEDRLAGFLRDGAEETRRASAIALGLMGSYRVNRSLGQALKDDDPLVRRLAETALWSVWTRAGTPAQNAELERVMRLNGEGNYREAEQLASALIRIAPDFAEAHNQRAIARYFQSRWDESASDCRRVLDLNPYHFGALGGLGKCYLNLGQPVEALDTYRRALKLQPHSVEILEMVRALERANL